jgi:lipopolysaccharide export LptBFGC system permease protein LptF
MVWVLAILALILTRQYVDTPNEGLVVIIGLLAAAMVMFWMGALDRLARQNAWSWFAGVLVLQLVGLGGLGMAAYMLAGPVDVDLPKPGISS